MAHSHDLFESLANSAPVLIWMSDTMKLCTWFNQPWLDFTGRTLEQEYGYGWADGVHPNDLARCLAIFTQAFDARQPFTMEYRLRRHDGEYRWILDNGVPRFEADGGFAGYIGSCIDITMRRESEQAVRASESKFRQLFERSSDAMFLVEGITIRDCNAAALTLFGCTTPDELVGQTVVALSPEIQPDGMPSAAKAHDIVDHAIRCGHARFEWWHCRVDGTNLPVEIAVTHLPDLERPMLLCVLRDLTARAQSAATLTRRTLMLSAIGEVAEQFLRVKPWRRALDDSLRRIGQAGDVSRVVLFERVSTDDGGDAVVFRGAWDAPHVPAQTPPAPVPPQPMRETGFERWRAAFAVGTPVSGHIRDFPATEQRALIPRAIRSSLAVPIMVDGQWWGFFGFDECRTEHEWSASEIDAAHAFARIVGQAIQREQAEEEIETRERFINAIAQGSPDIILVMDLLARRVPYLNRASDGQAFIPASGGLTFEGVSANLGVVHPDDIVVIERAATLARDMSDGEVRQFDFRLVLQTGEERRLEARHTAFERGEDGLVTHVLVFLRDVTERVAATKARAELEEHLRQAQKMQEIGQLAGGIAHDFNNLLTVILGNSQDLVNAAVTDPRSRRAAQHVRDAALRAAGLTRQLLTFSRQQPVRTQPLDLNPLVAEAAGMLIRVLGEPVNLIVDRAPDPLAVEADAGMLEQVIVNLAINGRDAMPNGGTLKISTASVEIDATAAERSADARPGAYAALRVTDTGHGMPPDVQSRIFEPFFTTKDVGKGTGLGLATVYGIIRQHRGWIEVSSEPGCGSTFTVYLPLTDLPVPAPVGPDAAGLLRGTETILLVEDEEAVRELLVDTLRSSGYTVIEAIDGHDARRRWDESTRRIHLLLTDISMPNGKSGLVLADELLALDPLLKVLFTSGYNHARPGAALQVSEAQFLAKPFQIPALLRAVRAQFDPKA